MVNDVMAIVFFRFFYLCIKSNVLLMLKLVEFLRVHKILIFNNIDISAALHYVDVAVTAAVML